MTHDTTPELERLTQASGAEGEPVAWRCRSCGHLTDNPPEVDLTIIQSRGAVSCCPERNMRPLFEHPPEAGERNAVIEEALTAQPSTAENPNEDSYQRGRFDGIMEYAKAIAAVPVPDDETTYNRDALDLDYLRSLAKPGQHWTHLSMPTAVVSALLDLVPIAAADIRAIAASEAAT